MHIFEGWHVVWEGSHDINVEFKELASSCQLLILYTQKAMLLFLIKPYFRIMFFICLHGICCLLILLAYLPSPPGHLGTCSQLGGVTPNAGQFRVSLCFREKQLKCFSVDSQRAGTSQVLSWVDTEYHNSAHSGVISYKAKWKSTTLFLDILVG